ncbi:hypothetical protein IE4803_CH03868 [Rhizobium etli bv. phaseoli str. IE4803]|nr:hypothetical protein IE4803_CH03868 [Rhizobium etli bv. phaseoli str. IE4803]
METMSMDAAARHVFHAQESAPTWRSCFAKIDDDFRAIASGTPILIKVVEKLAILI